MRIFREAENANFPGMFTVLELPKKRVGGMSEDAEHPQDTSFTAPASQLPASHLPNMCFHAKQRNGCTYTDGVFLICIFIALL